MKKRGLTKPIFEDILIPKNTAAGIYISGFAFLVGFAFVWEIIWLAVVGVIGIIVVFVKRAFNEDSEYVLTAAEVKTYEEERLKKASAANRRKADASEEEMSLWELIKIVLNFVKGIIKEKRWRKW